MNPNELVALVTAIAVLIARSVPDNDELGLLALVFTQLGDTLATIVAQRELISNRAETPDEEVILPIAIG
jgi:hypothetical protein